MVEKKLVAIFEKRPVRRHWDEKQGKWYFSVVDIVAILTDSQNPQVYWRVLKKRLMDEGSNETVTKCNRLKLVAPDGKMRLTDVADVETVFRLVQSVPSPKTEPLKLWLAKVGYERMRETVDPELSISRGRKNWQMMGRSKKWIEQRMRRYQARLSTVLWINVPGTECTKEPNHDRKGKSRASFVLCGDGLFGGGGVD